MSNKEYYLTHLEYFKKKSHDYEKAHPRTNATRTPQQLARRRQMLRISFRRWRLAHPKNKAKEDINKPLEKFLKEQIREFGLQSYFSKCHREKTTINRSPSLLEFDEYDGQNNYYGIP